MTVNVWLVAGTALGAVYPCRCRAGGQCSALWCPCAGRRDFWAWPAGCCAWVNTPDVAAAAQRAYSAGR